MSHGTGTYARVYINAVAGSVMLYLHDFYNVIFKVKQIIYSLRVSAPPMKNSGCAPDKDYGLLGYDAV